MLMALDTVQNFYGQGIMNFLATVASRAAVNNDIQSIIARPNLELTPKVANISQIHLVLTVRWGTLILYGVKPRTGFYVLQFSFANGYPEFELIPLEDVPLSKEPAPSKRSLVQVEEVPVHVTSEVVDPRTDFFESVSASLARGKQEVAR
jgi:hypothetical protein